MLNTFPREIITKILFGLPIKYLFRSRLACKLFAEIVTLQNIDYCYQNITGREFLWIEYLLLKYYRQEWVMRTLTEKMPLEVILRYPKYKWSLSGLLRNKDVTWEMAKEYYHNPPIKTVHDHSKVNFAYDFSRNPNVTIDIIRKYPNLKWDWSGLSFNRAFAVNDVLSNPDLPWYSDCCAFLATEKDIIDNPNINNPDNINSEARIRMIINENLSLDFLKERIDLSSYIGPKCGTSLLAHRKNLTWEELQRIPRKYWVYDVVAKNKNISWENIRDTVSSRFDVTSLAIYRPREVALYCELVCNVATIHWKLRFRRQKMIYTASIPLS